MNINYPTGARKHMNRKISCMVEETINSERKHKITSGFRKENIFRIALLVSPQLS
jgi:hypothetical protein